MSIRSDSSLFLTVLTVTFLNHKTIPLSVTFLNELTGGRSRVLWTRRFWFSSGSLDRGPGASWTISAAPMPRVFWAWGIKS